MGVDINWGMAGGNNALGMFQQGAQMGQQIRQQREQREHQNALLDLRKQEGAQRQAEFASQQEERATKQQEAMRTKTQQMARLFAHAEKGPEQWEQAKAAAAQLGFDTTAIPQAYDPNWAAQQRLIVDAFGKDGGEALSTAGKQAIDMGFKPGTPEFNKAVQDIWAAGEAQPYVEGGNTRLYTPKIGGPGEVAGATEGATATNPQTGEKVQFRGGQWVPMGGGGGNVTSSFLDGL